MSYDKYVFDTAKAIHYRFPTHTNDLILNRVDAETSEVFFVVMEPGEASPVHVHKDTEQIFYMLQGSGTLSIGKDNPKKFPIKVGDLVRIPPHTPHSVVCESKEAVRYLCVDCFTGGRPKDEPTWEAHVRVLCADNGWDFDKVKQK